MKFGRKNVTLVHKGNIMKFTEGAFRDWGYQVAKEFYGAEEIDGGPWCRIPAGKPGAGLVIKDAIADITLQQVLTRPDEFDVIATPNLNGDYLSDALAAQVGGIGIAPGGNINYVTGHAVFEATHGTAPKYADQDKVNPGSVILSGEMMLRHLGWNEAADLVVKGMDGAIAAKRVTYDFARLMDGRDGAEDVGVRRRHHQTHVDARMTRRARRASQSTKRLRISAASAVSALIVVDEGAVDESQSDSGRWRGQRRAPPWRAASRRSSSPTSSSSTSPIRRRRASRSTSSRRARSTDRIRA